MPSMKFVLWVLTLLNTALLAYLWRKTRQDVAMQHWVNNQLHAKATRRAA